MISLQVDKNFLKNFDKELNKLLAPKLDVIGRRTKINILDQTKNFRGHVSTPSIADSSSVSSSIQKSKLRVNIFPATQQLRLKFLRNKNATSGYVLYQEQDPAWFADNNILTDRVNVRATGDTAGFRVPLGDSKRDFFFNTFKYLETNVIRIIEGNN